MNDLSYNFNSIRIVKMIEEKIAVIMDRRNSSICLAEAKRLVAANVHVSSCLEKTNLFL